MYHITQYQETKTSEKLLACLEANKIKKKRKSNAFL